MKYIVQRYINTQALEYAEYLRDFTLEGYTAQFNDIKRSAKNNGQRSSITLMKPEDVQWLKDNTLEKAKLEAGFLKKDSNFEDYIILKLPHDVDWVDFKSLRNSENVKQRKCNYFDMVSQFNFGFPITSHADITGTGSLKNGEWLQTIEDKMVSTYSVYERDLESVTDEIRTVAEELYQVYSEKKESSKAQKTVKNDEMNVQESVEEK